MAMCINYDHFLRLGTPGGAKESTAKFTKGSGAQMMVTFSPNNFACPAAHAHTP
jgi:hypothetical protein